MAYHGDEIDRSVGIGVKIRQGFVWSTEARWRVWTRGKDVIPVVLTLMNGNFPPPKHRAERGPCCGQIIARATFGARCAHPVSWIRCSVVQVLIAGAEFGTHPIEIDARGLTGKRTRGIGSALCVACGTLLALSAAGPCLWLKKTAWTVLTLCPSLFCIFTLGAGKAIHGTWETRPSCEA